MIISDEQARLAAECIRDSAPSRSAFVAGDVSPDLMNRVMLAMADAPELRADRVESARAHLASGDLSSHEIASKLLARVISDGLR